MDTGPPAAGEFDRELDVKSVGLFGAGLALVMLVVLASLWILLVHWKGTPAAGGPRPSPLAEANARRLPPEPRLQSDPVKDMTALRARETAALTTYGWVDRQAGVARIPIDRAIDLLLENGLPAPPPEPSPAPPPKRPRRLRGRS
jgi:hypothetical protein